METFVKPKVETFSDLSSLSQQCVAYFVNYAEEAIKTNNVFYAAVSGGKTPKHFFELLAESPKAKSIKWEKVHLFWVDERYVSADSQYSNYRLASESFISKVAIPSSNIHKIGTGYHDIALAAQKYEEEMLSVFGLKKGEIPRFDLIVLGMGSDGHTASLFPGWKASGKIKGLACAVHVNNMPGRITLTPAVLRAANHLLVLVSGGEKAEILKKVMTCEPNEDKYPIQILMPVMDKVTWLIDSQAAKEITHINLQQHAPA